MNAGPYRSPDTTMRVLILDAITSARDSQQQVLKAIERRNDSIVVDKDDVAMIDKLEDVYRCACEHERELLKQLGGLEP